eukprot:258270_1
MSNNRIPHSKSPSLGRFVVNFNGIEKKIVLKESKGEYTMDRLKTKVFGKFKKLGTTDFHLQLNNGSSISCDDDIILNLLGQDEPLPKCNVFIGIPQFDIDVESISSNSSHDEQDDDATHTYFNSPISPLPNAASFELMHANEDDEDDDTAIVQSSKYYHHGRLNNHSISNLIKLKSIVNQHDVYQGHREYICCLNNVLMKMTLTMFDIAKYDTNWFKNRFLSLFDHKLAHNESLQFRVYHISTKQYIAIKLPLWSYDSQHYHIEGDVLNDDDDHHDNGEDESISIHDFEDVLKGLETDLKSQQKEFEEMVANINISINDIHSKEEIYLWKKHKFKLKEIERDMTLFSNNYQMRLNEGLSHHLNTKHAKLKQICDSKVEEMNELQSDIAHNKCQIAKMEKAIRHLTIENHSKQMEMQREENLWNISKNKLKQLQHFKNKVYKKMKSQLNEEIVSFESAEKIKIYELQKQLNQIFKRFELNYLQWTLDDAVQWIISIQNFYFSNDKFNPFIETLKTHRFVGKNLNELRAPFTLNVMGLNHFEDQQLLIKNINRIMNKARRTSYTHTQKQTIFDSTPSTASAASQGNLCCICAENEINTVIIPCGHMVYCSNCSKKLTINSCPTCRGKDVKIMITYKSGL